jgi:hypothetical protein
VAHLEQSTLHLNQLPMRLRRELLEATQPSHTFNCVKGFVYPSHHFIDRGFDQFTNASHELIDRIKCVTYVDP